MSGLALACPDPEVSTRRRGTESAVMRIIMLSTAPECPSPDASSPRIRSFFARLQRFPGSCMKNEFAIFSPWWVAKKTCRCGHMQVQGLRVEHDARRALASGRPFGIGRKPRLGWSSSNIGMAGAMYDVVSVVAQGTVGLQLGPPSQRRSIRSRAQWPEEVVMPTPCQTRHGLAGDNTA